MKLTEQFTPEQLRAIEDLEKVFGPTDVSVSEVSEYYAKQYTHYASQYIAEALQQIARAKMAETIDFAEIKRLQDEEYARKLAERSAEVRGNIMMGIFTSLLGKLSKLGEVEFESVDHYIRMACRISEEEFLYVEYNKDNYLLTTKTEDGLFEDDATLVKGSEPFREQFTGVEAVFSYLEGRK